jgi:hypothetical protein
MKSTQSQCGGGTTTPVAVKSTLLYTGGVYATGLYPPGMVMVADE